MSLVSGCSIDHHLSKAQKHIDIAKRKGAIIKPDTIWHHVYETDTVWNYTNNTFETRQVVKDSFPYTITNTISSGMTRQERRHLDDMFKHMEKMMKLQNDSLKLALKYQTKQHRQNKKTDRLVTRRENRSNPWIWVILAALLVVAIYLIKQK
jgi:glutamyl-tRNA reductase